MPDEEIALLAEWIKSDAAWPEPIAVLFKDEPQFLSTLALIGRRRFALSLLLPAIQIRIGQRFAQQNCSFSSEMQSRVRQIRGFDDREARIGASEFIQGSIDLSNVAPWCFLVLLGDEPGKLGLLEVRARLVDQVLHPFRVVL